MRIETMRLMIVGAVLECIEMIAREYDPIPQYNRAIGVSASIGYPQFL